MVKSCPSNLLPNECEMVLLKSNFNHNHESSENINRQVVANSLKKSYRTGYNTTTKINSKGSAIK